MSLARGGGGGGGDHGTDRGMGGNSTRTKFSYPPRPAVVMVSDGRSCASRPFTWEELVDIVARNDMAALLRNQDTQWSYTLYNIAVKRRWNTVAHHILYLKFPQLFSRRLTESNEQNEAASQECEPTRGEHHDHNDDDDDDDLFQGIALAPEPPAGYVWQVVPPPSHVVGTHKSLRPNDFPYFVPPHVEHWVLWKLGTERVTQTDVDQAIADLKQSRAPVLDSLHWTNPPHLQSIPEIDHAHILIRRANHTSADTER